MKLTELEVAQLVHEGRYAWRVANMLAVALDDMRNEKKLTAEALDAIYRVQYSLGYIHELYEIRRKPSKRSWLITILKYLRFSPANHS
ncbi:MAG: hypothetical protein ACPGGK_08910 [Pikeienuella sp.]